MRIASPAIDSSVVWSFLSLTLVVVAIINSSVSLALKQVTLKEVCLNRQVPIGSVDEARRLIGDLKAKPEACMQNYLQSFQELEQLLQNVDNNNKNHDLTLCGEKKFNQIKEFHFRYIQPPVEMLDKLSDDDYKQRQLVPVALAQFFKSWALQASGMCKRTLLANLDKATQLLTGPDYELLEGKSLQVSPEQVAGNLFGAEANETKPEPSANTGGNFFTRLFGARKPQEAPKEVASVASPNAVAVIIKKFKYDLSFQKLVYMPELEGELETGDIERMQTIKALDLRSKPELSEYMHTCERRFRPIYSRLIMPIVRLAKLGYDYVGPALNDIRGELLSDPLVIKWMLVTMVCESQGRVELTRAPGQLEKAQLADYEPIYTYKVEGELWVKGGEALRRELDRTNREQLKGFKKFLYKAGLRGRKLVETIDPLQHAWYRRNQALIMSCLITTSILMGIVSKTVKVSG